jgi:uncharacterized protein YecA (UPF0149 family)
LARIDQRVLAELDHSGGVQMVRVPVSDAVWSTWRRYCEALGVSMGVGVAKLIGVELETVVDGEGSTAAQLADHIAQKAGERSLQLDARQQKLEAQSEALQRKEDRLRTWEQNVRTRHPAGADNRYTVKVGRNERCPCGSGFKYKHCHGLPGRSE